MSTISNITRNIANENTLSLFNSMSSSTSSTAKTNNILGIDLAEYSSITRGSYSKLVKAYYAKYGNTDALDGTDKTDSTATKTTLKSDAKELFDAANTLSTTGNKSVFKKVEQTDETTGEKSMGYDTDKIYKAVSRLVDSYNDLVKNSTDSQDNSVLRQTLHMVNSTTSNGSLLNDIGIKINSDNTLSLDEETFKKANMSTAQTLFNGSDSFGAKIQAAASNIYLNINNSLGNSNTYTQSGTLGNYSTGNILDSLL